MKRWLAIAATLCVAPMAQADGFRVLGVAPDGAVLYEEWGPAGESGYAFAAIRRAPTAAGAAPPETLGEASETDRLDREIDARTRARARASRALGTGRPARPLTLASAPPPAERDPESATAPGATMLALAGQPRGRTVRLDETPRPAGASDHGCAALLGRPPTDATVTVYGPAGPLARADGIAEATGLAPGCPVRFGLAQVLAVGQGGRLAAVLAVLMPGQRVVHAVVGLTPP